MIYRYQRAMPCYASPWPTLENYHGNQWYPWDKWAQIPWSQIPWSIYDGWKKQTLQTIHHSPDTVSTTIIGYATNPPLSNIQNYPKFKNCHNIGVNQPCSNEPQFDFPVFCELKPKFCWSNGLMVAPTKFVNHLVFTWAVFKTLFDAPFWQPSQAVGHWQTSCCTEKPCGTIYFGQKRWRPTVPTFSTTGVSVRATGNCWSWVTFVIWRWPSFDCNHEWTRASASGAIRILTPIAQHVNLLLLGLLCSAL